MSFSPLKGFITDDPADEEAGCGVPGLAWLHVVVRPIGCTDKFSKIMLEVAYVWEINLQLSGNSSGGHSCQQHANCTIPSKHETSVELCCVTKLNILEWSCIVPSTSCTCVMIRQNI